MALIMCHAGGDLPGPLLKLARLLTASAQKPHGSSNPGRAINYTDGK